MNRGNEKSPFRKNERSPFRVEKEKNQVSQTSSDFKFLKKHQAEPMTPVKGTKLAQSTNDLTFEQNESPAQKDLVKAVFSEQSSQKDNVKVVIRVRPVNDREKCKYVRLTFEESGNQKSCLVVENAQKITLDRGVDQKMFTFDYVADDQSTQSEVFNRIAKPIADSCLQGYNGTIFAYGQTGSGKTFTIQGPMITVNNEEQLISAQNSSGATLEMRGIMQRSFEHIFSKIEQEKSEAEQNGCECKYLVKTSYLEIYNEQIMDLLDPSAQNLHIREDIKTGVYVEGLSEETISNSKDMFDLIARGARNRHVGSTQMNKESSRSHSVLTTLIESKTMTASGVWQMKSSQFHVIDLAGSERSKHTQAEGQRLKEAGMINKSLSALGIVINSLVDISEGKARHVHYRDSKLTFLLRDSLGGNSKTLMIANITPSTFSINETISTLKFAQRAKLIKNKAIINEESSGTIALLKQEIKRLKQQMAESQRVPDRLGENICQLCKAENQVGHNEFLDDMLIDGSAQKRRNLSILDNKKLSDRVTQLESLLTANLDNLTSAQKLYELDQEKKQQSMMRMQTALDTLEKQASRDKMIIKFRDQRIQKLEQSLAHEAGCKMCETTAAENEALRKERDEWREAYEKQSHAQASKLFAEKDLLERKLIALQLEQKQSPESLSVQVRSLNELTDGLSKYLKEYCDKRQGVDTFEHEQKQQLLQQVMDLNEQLDLEKQNSLKNQDLKTHLDLLQTQYQQKLEDLQIEHAKESERLQHVAKLQLEELKNQIQANVSHTESEYHQFKINSIEIQNELQGKLAHAQDLIREGEKKTQVYIEKIEQLKEDADNLVQKLFSVEEDREKKLKEAGLIQEKLQESYNISKAQNQQEISYLNKLLLWEKSERVSVTVDKERLSAQIIELEKANDQLQKQLLFGQESAQELGAQVREFELKLHVLIKEKVSQEQEFGNQKNSYETKINEILQQQQNVASEKEETQQKLLRTQSEHADLVRDLERRIQESQQQYQLAQTEMELGKQALSQLINTQKEKIDNQAQQYNLLQQIHDQLRQDYAKEISEQQANQHQSQVQNQEKIYQLRCQVDQKQKQLEDSEEQVQSLLKQLQQVEQVFLERCNEFEVKIQKNQEQSNLQLQQSVAERRKIEMQINELQLEKQKLVNQVKSGELTNVELQQQVINLKSEMDLQQQKFSLKIVQVEESVKQSLDADKQATKQALQQNFQEQLQRADSEVRRQMQLQYEIQLQAELEQQELKLSQQNQRHLRNLIAKISQVGYQLKVVKQQYQLLRSDMDKRNWQLIAPSLQQFQFMIQKIPNPAAQLAEEIKTLKLNHTKVLQTQMSKESQLKQEVSAQQEELNEYKGLTKQLQDEKQDLISSVQKLQKQNQDARNAVANREQQQQEQMLILNARMNNVISEKAMECDSLRLELDTVRNKHIDACTELAKHKSKISDLTTSLNAKKDTVQVLMNEKNNLMAEVKKRIEEIGHCSQQWQNKVSEQKRELNEIRAERDLLKNQQQMELKLKESDDSLHKERDSLKNELYQTKLAVGKRESELKEVVRTLKKFSDEKKALELEIEKLRKDSDMDGGHQNQAQKIQHHLKIKEENNRLREENYQLKEELRRKVEIIGQPKEDLVQKANRDCAQVCDIVDKLVDFIVQQPTVGNFLGQNKKLQELLKKIPASTSTHAAQMAQQKAKVAAEVITHIGKNLQSLIKAQNEMKMIQGDQNTRSQKQFSPPKAVINLQNSQKPPIQSNQQDSRLVQATQFLNNYSQRSQSSNAFVRHQ